MVLLAMQEALGELPGLAPCRASKGSLGTEIARGNEMETVLGGVAFACLIAAQFFAVVAVHRARWEREPSKRDASRGDDHAQHICNFGS